MKQRLRLREIEQSDLPLFFAHQRDPVAVALVGFQSRGRAAFDEHWAKLLADPAVVIRTIVVATGPSADLAEQQVAGHVASFVRDGKRELGYWLDRAFWGQGIASLAVAEFLLLERRRPLHAVVAPHNWASLRVLQKCGFTLLESGEDKCPERVLLILR